MFKFPDHQVAGHSAHEGKLGPLIDDSGNFYKPLQDGARGSKEASFYKAFSSNTTIPCHIRKFFPGFHGIQLVESSDGSGPRNHLVLQDVVAGRSNPSVMDVKIGSRTWYTEANEDYIQRCFKKDRETTTVSLGFRISGFQIFQNNENGFWKPGRKQVLDFDPEDAKFALRKFVSSNSRVDAEIPDCLFAQIVYSGILAQLTELKAWFEKQTVYHFHSSSVLMFFEKEKLLEGRDSIAEVKLVDFAHFVDGKGVIDHNFLGGLCSLIQIISEILDSSDKSFAKASNPETDNGYY